METYRTAAIGREAMIMYGDDAVKVTVQNLLASAGDPNPEDVEIRWAWSDYQDNWQWAGEGEPPLNIGLFHAVMIDKGHKWPSLEELKEKRSNG